MKIEFKVHNASEVPVSVMVPHDGATVAASVQALEVELTTVKDSHGSLTLRFTGAEREAAKEFFKPGKVVSWSL